MINTLFSQLHNENWLKGLDRNSFLDRAAYYICELNAIHPFREGNGRIIRLYIDYLAVRSLGDLFDWTLTTQAEYLKACVDGFQHNYSSMFTILRRCFTSSLEPHK
jgi:cell filamentation protein